MNRDFQGSIANDFSESPGKERGAANDCSRVGIINGVMVFKYGNFRGNGAQANPNIYGGFDFFVTYPFGGGQPTWPKPDYWKLRITTTVISAPTTPYTPGFTLLSWRYPPAHAAEDFFAGISLPSDHVGYFDDGEEFLTEVRAVGTLLYPPFGADPFVNYAVPRSGLFYTVPSTPGDYVLNYKIRSRNSCHTFFKAFGVGGTSNFPPGGHTAATIEQFGNHTVTCLLMRVFRMIVRYQASAVNVTIGQSIQFTDRSATDNIKTAFLWSFGDGTTSTLQNPTKSYAAPGTYQVRLSITDSSEETYTSIGPEILTITVT